MSRALDASTKWTLSPISHCNLSTSQDPSSPLARGMGHARWCLSVEVTLPAPKVWRHFWPSQPGRHCWHLGGGGPGDAPQHPSVLRKHPPQWSASSDWEILSLSEWTWRENTRDEVAAQILHVNYSGSRWSRAQQLLVKGRPWRLQAEQGKRGSVSKSIFVCVGQNFLRGLGPRPPAGICLLLPRRCPQIPLSPPGPFPPPCLAAGSCPGRRTRCPPWGGCRVLGGQVRGEWQMLLSS